MPLDSATYPAGLDPTIPADSNFAYEGDDHIRTIKTVLKNAFGSITGAVKATQDDLPLGKKNATTAPVAGNDSSQGYAPGSIWVDLTNDKSYICVDATVAAAIWHQIDNNPIASGQWHIFFQSSTAVMTGWTFRTFDSDYVIGLGATNNVGGTNNGVTPDNTGWAISGISATQPSHTHPPGSLTGTFDQTLTYNGGSNRYGYNGANPSVVFGGNTGASSVDTVTVAITGAWRPPTVFGTVWSKD